LDVRGSDVWSFHPPCVSSRHRSRIRTSGRRQRTDAANPREEKRLRLLEDALQNYDDGLLFFLVPRQSWRMLRSAACEAVGARHERKEKNLQLQQRTLPFP
jgi:hypothetical protein